MNQSQAIERAAPSRPSERVISIVQQAPRSLDETLRIAELLANSGYFDDAKGVAQAVTKILYGVEVGIAPVTAMMSVHIINGKPAPSAGLLASRIRSSKRYDYRIKRLDNEACEIEFLDGGQVVGISTFTQDDARAAGAHDGRNKHTWKAFARNMLFARCISNGARWWTPDLFGGPVYTPEELGAEVNGEGDVIDVPYVPMRERDVDDAAPQAQPDMVTSADSRIWQRWLTVKAEAEDLGIRVSELRLPMAKAELAERGQKVFEAIERRKQQLAAQDAEIAAGKAAHESASEDRAADDGQASEVPQGRPEETSPSSGRHPSRSDLWAENRELCNRAAELKLTGVPTLPQRSTDDVLASANEELARRIENYELAQQATSASGVAF